MFGYVIDWSAVGICATALIAVWKLSDERREKAADREMETKREILFDGVRAMSEVQASFSALTNLSTSHFDSAEVFQKSMARMTVASSVASLGAAKAGKEYADTIGPLFLIAMTMRMQLDQMPGDIRDPPFRAEYFKLREFVLDNLIEPSKAMVRSIAAVRADVKVAKEPQELFLAAMYPNEALIKDAINRSLGLTQQKAPDTLA